MKSYIFIILSTVLLGFGAITAFTYLVDPIGNRELLVENRFKDLPDQRSFKYQILTQTCQEYSGIILGSSRVMQIPPPPNVLNLGLGGENNQERLFLFEKFLECNPDLEDVYLGLSFFNFNTQIGALRQVQTHKFTTMKRTNPLKRDHFRLSIKAFERKIDGKSLIEIQKNGLLRNYGFERYVKRTSAAGVRKVLDLPKIINQKLGFIFTKRYKLKGEFIYDPEAFTALKELVNLAKQHEINLQVFIPPEHQFVTYMRYADPELKQISQTIKRGIVDLFGDYIDFSGINEISTDNLNWQDYWHYRQIIGERIMARLLSDSPIEEFGISVNRENLEAYMATEELQMKSYTNEATEVIDQIMSPVIN